MAKKTRYDDYDYDDQGNVLFRFACGLLSWASGGDKRMDIPVDDKHTKRQWPKGKGNDES